MTVEKKPEKTVLKKKKFELATAGAHRARLDKFVNEGLKTNSWGKESLHGRFEWILLDQEDKEGTPLRVFESFPSLSLGKKSIFGQALREILAREPDDEVVPDDLVGIEVELYLKHSEPDTNGHTWANVKSHLRKKTAAEVAEERRRNQAANQEFAARNAAKAAHISTQIADDDVPY
jgi:hypothetical protein